MFELRYYFVFITHKSTTKATYNRNCIWLRKMRSTAQKPRLKTQFYRKINKYNVVTKRLKNEQELNRYDERKLREAYTLAAVVTYT